MQILKLALALLPVAVCAAGREGDPVVVAGAGIAPMLGKNPAQIVAFRYNAGWTQIPVQIDERMVIDFGKVYHQSNTGLTFLGYADGGTWTGIDPDATFDSDDELVFMAKDVGSRVPAVVSLPAGAQADPVVEVAVNDPLSGPLGYVYLFLTDGSLTPGAGQNYVTYAFNLLSGSYFSTYKISAGPNPENTSVTTSAYREHFGDRWVRDETNVYAGGASGVDILDRHKNLFGPGSCSRSEDSFSSGEGCFVCNIDGPVRAIRSYLGANSGPFTQRTNIFYEARQDIATNLRVHVISGIMDLYDYSPAASGMTYYNSLLPGGVLVDGNPDSVPTGAITWEMVTGAQGSLALFVKLVTDISGLTYTSYYSDDSTPSVTQCTGDAFEYGESGVWINQTIPNTDPTFGTAKILTALRTQYYLPPNQPTSAATERLSLVQNPLTASAARLRVVSGTISFDSYVGAPISAVSMRVSALGEFPVDLSASGAYRVAVPAAPLTLSVKHSHWLRRTVATDTTASSQSDVNLTLDNGDSDPDNFVGLFDLNAELVYFGQVDPLADLDGSGLVDLFDLNIALTAFATSGDP